MEELQIIMSIFSISCFLEYIQGQYNISYFTIFLFVNTIFLYYLYKSLHISIKLNLYVTTDKED
jgi:hypothetical protein